MYVTTNRVGRNSTEKQQMYVTTNRVGKNYRETTNRVGRNTEKQQTVQQQMDVNTVLI